MKWTPAGSHGSEVILKPLARERVFDALDKLQDSGHGPTQASIWPVNHHTPGAYHRFEPLKALFFPAREHIGSYNNAAEHVIWAWHEKHICFYHFGGSTKWL